MSKPKAATAPAKRELTAKQARFVDEYLVDLNATQAAIRAGYSKKTANEIGAENLAKPSIQEAVQARMLDRQKRTEITADDVLKHWAAIGFADASELMEMRRTCCRYCHGEGFLYQFTPSEYERHEADYLKAAEEAERKNEPAPVFDERGGIGYNKTHLPHPDCPECFGEGELQPFFKDTRTASDIAKKLFAGVKVSKDGTQILVHDQLAAVANIARHLGMFVDKTDLTSGGKPLPPPASTIAPEQMREIVKQVMDEY